MRKPVILCVTLEMQPPTAGEISCHRDRKWKRAHTSVIQMLTSGAHHVVTGQASQQTSKPRCTCLQIPYLFLYLSVLQQSGKRVWKLSSETFLFVLQSKYRTPEMLGVSTAGDENDLNASMETAQISRFTQFQQVLCSQTMKLISEPKTKQITFERYLTPPLSAPREPTQRVLLEFEGQTAFTSFAPSL